MEKNPNHETWKFFRDRDRLREIVKEIDQLDKEFKQIIGKGEEMNEEKNLSKKLEEFLGENGNTGRINSVAEVARESVEKNQADHLVSESQFGDSHNIEIYYDRVFLDGFPLKAVRRGKTKINGAADSESDLTVTLELRAKDVSIHPTFYSPAGDGSTGIN